MAIVTLLVIFALCSILLTVTELGVAHNRTIVESVYSRADVNRIADEFAILVRDGGGTVSDEAINAFKGGCPAQYEIVVEPIGEGEGFKLTATLKESEHRILDAVYDGTGKITSIRYSTGRDIQATAGTYCICANANT